jgi:hypothetical protein
MNAEAAEASKSVGFRTLEELNTAFTRRHSTEEKAPDDQQQHKQTPHHPKDQQRRVSPADAPAKSSCGPVFGIIRSVFRQKGFAFISADDGVGDVFLHVADLRCEGSNDRSSRYQSETGCPLAVGMRVRYFREQGHSFKARVASGGRAKRATIVDEKAEVEEEQEEEMIATSEEASAVLSYSRGELLAALIGLRGGARLGGRGGNAGDSVGAGNYLGFKAVPQPVKRESPTNTAPGFEVDEDHALAAASSEDSDESESHPAGAQPSSCYSLWGGPAGTALLGGPLLQSPPPGLQRMGSDNCDSVPGASISVRDFAQLFAASGPEACVVDQKPGFAGGVCAGGLRAEAPCFEPSSSAVSDQLTGATREAVAEAAAMRAEAPCFEPAPAWANEFDARCTEPDFFNEYWAANAWTYMQPFEADECRMSAEDTSTAAGSASDEGDGPRELVDVGLEAVACA